MESKETIKQILMERDGMSDDEARNLIIQADVELNYRLEDGDLDAAYDICDEFFGLEPDYLHELL